MSYEPLHHKYRPQTFAELVGQEAIATTLTNAIRTSKIAPAYLFTGSRGTGKTSSARILAKSLNCLKSAQPTPSPCGVCDVCQGIAKGATFDVIEIDAASNTGVDNIRELIERAQFAPVQCRYKVYIIDEVHMLSSAAFNALLKTLEEPPNSVVFILATTDPQRVLPTIISRCQRFDFRRIPIEPMVTHLSNIASKEDINITPEAVQIVAQIAQGGLRDAESLLDQLSLLSSQVTVEQVWDLVGSCSEPDLLELLKAIAQHNSEAILDRARTIMERGREPLTVLQNLASFYRDLLIAKTAPHRNDLVACTQATWKALCEEAILWDIPTILAGQQHLAKSEVQLKNTTQPRLWLEVALLGLLHKAELREDRKAHNHQHSKPIQPIPPQQVVKAVENSQLPVQQENPQPSVQQDDTFVPTPEPVAEVQKSQSTSGPLSEENSTSDTPRTEIWQQVLANLQPKSTQALLRQMGHLINFDGKVARIGMKSPVWCKQAKNYLPNIKAAFQETFKREVQVNLELATSTPSKNASINQQPFEPATPPVTEQTANHIVTETSSIQPQPIIPAEFPTLDVANYTSMTLAEEENDQVAIASQRLAEVFKGEVVKLNLDLAFPQPIETNSLSSKAIFESYNTDIEGEEDIDF